MHVLIVNQCELEKTLDILHTISTSTPFVSLLYFPGILDHWFLFHMGVERYLSIGPLSRGFVSCLVAPGPHVDYSSWLDDNDPCAGDQR